MITYEKKLWKEHDRKQGKVQKKMAASRSNYPQSKLPVARSLIQRLIMITSGPASLTPPGVKRWWSWEEILQGIKSHFIYFPLESWSTSNYFWIVYEDHNIFQLYEA